MIKENQKHFNRLQVLIDAFVIAFSYIMAWVIKFQILKNDDGKLPFKIYMMAMVVIVAVYLVLYHMFSPQIFLPHFFFFFKKNPSCVPY